MKKLTIILILALLLGSLAAQEMAWINPVDYSDLTLSGDLPGSMLSYVSSGIFYDEWDVVFHAPAELSNYTGINLLTSYGNFGSWWGGEEIVNPFTTGTALKPGTFTPAPFVVGVSMPLMKYRVAAIGGFDFAAVTNRVTLGAGTTGTRQATSLVVVDGATIGAADYTMDGDFSYTDYTQRNFVTLAGGADLGFLGASIIGKFDYTTTVIGGHRGYTYTHGTDPAFVVQPNTITNYSFNVGSANGATKIYGADAGIDRGQVGILAELPSIPNLPITAELDVAWSSRLFDGFALTRIPAFYARTTSVVGGVNGTTGTYSYTTAAGPSSAWTYNLPATVQAGAPLSAAQLFTASQTYITAAPYDMGRLAYGNLSTGIKAGVDPVIKLGSNIKLVSRAKLGYSFGLEPTKTAVSTDIAYRSPISVNAADDVQFTMSYDNRSSSTAIHNDITTELGGVFEFSGSNGDLVLGTGFFAMPSAYFATTTTGVSTTTYSKTFVDATNSQAALDMPATTGNAAVAALVNGVVPYRGVSAYTATVTTTGAINDATYDFQFVLPFSAKMKFSKAKLQLVGGYDIYMDVWYAGTRNNQHASNTVYSGVTLTNATGVNQLTADPAVSVAATTNTSASGAWYTSAATGYAKWMLRWDPLSSMTVDFLGSSVIDALNFNLFGATTGNFAFNPSHFINSLSMSVTFHF